MVKKSQLNDAFVFVAHVYHLLSDSRSVTSP